MRVVNRIHNYASHLGPAPQPTGATSLADDDIGVFYITHLPQGRHALDQHFAILPRRQSQLRPPAITAEKLHFSARAAC